MILLVPSWSCLVNTDETLPVILYLIEWTRKYFSFDIKVKVPVSTRIKIFGDDRSFRQADFMETAYKVLYQLSHSEMQRLCRRVLDTSLWQKQWRWPGNIQWSERQMHIPRRNLAHILGNILPQPLLLWMLSLFVRRRAWFFELCDCSACAWFKFFIQTKLPSSPVLQVTKFLSHGLLS